MRGTITRHGLNVIDDFEDFQAAFARGAPVFFAPDPVELPPDPPKPRTPAAARTRSPRWRAGSRRTRRLARRPGPCPRPADPFAGWVDLGWIDDDGEAYAPE